MPVKMLENAVWTHQECADLPPSTPREYEELQEDNARALKELQDSVWALLYSAEEQCIESGFPSLTTPDYERFQKDNACALNELQQLEKEIEAEKYAGEEETIQMEFGVAKKILDESDHLKVESDCFEAEMTLHQQETVFEVLIANMAKIMQDEKSHSKQWQEDFEEEMGEETLTAFEREDILQIETEVVLKECDQLDARAEELRKESDHIKALTCRRAKELLRGAAAADRLKAESARCIINTDPKKTGQKTQRAKAMVQKEAQDFLKAKSERCFSKGCKKLLPRTKEAGFQSKLQKTPTQAYAEALPVLLGSTGFMGRERDLALHGKPAKSGK